jgi:hypothetical protein
MAAPKGNKFWEARSSHGADPKFEHASDLWDACLEYFEWVETNPLYEDKLVTFQGAATHEPVRKMRAMTVMGLCVFLGISTDTWHEWRRSREDLSDVIARVDQIMRQQKFEGAAADLLNPNIIARDLGLTDRQENKIEAGDALTSLMERIGKQGRKITDDRS